MEGVWSAEEGGGRKAGGQVRHDQAAVPAPGLLWSDPSGREGLGQGGPGAAPQGGPWAPAPWGEVVRPRLPPLPPAMAQRFSPLSPFPGGTPEVLAGAGRGWQGLGATVSPHHPPWDTAWLGGAGCDPPPRLSGERGMWGCGERGVQRDPRRGRVPSGAGPIAAAGWVRGPWGVSGCRGSGGLPGGPAPAPTQ